MIEGFGAQQELQLLVLLAAAAAMLILAGPLRIPYPILLVFGGLLLGLAENLAYWKLDPQWSEAVTFMVLFAFIIFRPSGFFGTPTAAR